MIYLYNIILILTILLLLPAFFIKLIIDRRYRPGLLERLGFLPAEVESALQGERPVWFHAASVGEVNASVKLVSEIKARWPDKKIIVSTFTATGNAMAREKLAAHAVIYLPIDIPFVVRKIMKRINPLVLIIMETEIWPNLIHEAHRVGSPMILVSGRISDKSLSKYRKIRWLLKGVFQKTALIMTQSESNAERFIELGAKPEKIVVTGNLKFDMSISNIDLQYMNEWEGPVFIAGSTRKGEDELILTVYTCLRKKYPHLKLILAPRHIDRTGEIEKLLKGNKLPYMKQSDVSDKIESSVLLVDTLGKLSSLYKYGDVVFVGGSLIPVGGQNVLEPALLGKPVLFGPHMENFRESAALLVESGGGLKVNSASELELTVERLLADEDERIKMGKKARQVVLKNQGAIEKTLEHLSHFIQ